jgi:hypothetical protein
VGGAKVVLLFVQHYAKAMLIVAEIGFRRRSVSTCAKWNPLPFLKRWKPRHLASMTGPTTTTD